MFSLVWNAVSRLEMMGFKVLALCCDGLAANCRLFQLHDVKSNELCTKSLTHMPMMGKSAICSFYVILLI